MQTNSSNALGRPLFACRCSGSGDESCTETSDTAEGMRAHYSVMHHWKPELDQVRWIEMRYRELGRVVRPQLVRED